MKTILVFAVSLTMLFANPESIKSDIDAKDSICRARKFPISASYDERAVTLQKFFSGFNSPLAPYAGRFVYWADYYGVDYRLVPAITGVESTFGKRIPLNSFNAYGWNNGAYKFKSWEESIEHVTKTLRFKYIDKGANTVDLIARRYAPPSNTWSKNVKYLVFKIDESPIEFDL